MIETIERRRVPASAAQEVLKPAPKIEMYGFSVPKDSRIGRPNEDTIIFSPGFGYAGVFDGLGGLANGALSSQAAGEFFSEALKRDFDEVLQGPNGQREVAWSLYWISEKAGKSIREVLRGQRQGEGKTTAAVVKLAKSNKGLNLLWVNLGDSRIYILKRNGELEQVSIDDNLLSEVTRFSLHGEHLEGLRDVSRKLDDIADEYRLKKIRLKGGIKPPMAVEIFPNDVDAEGNLLEYLYYHRNVVRKALGASDISVGYDKPNFWNIGVVSLKPGDRIALTTDGVHDNLLWRNIRTILRSDAKDPAQALVKAALKRSRSNHFRAKRDDMSAVVIDIKAA